MTTFGPETDRAVLSMKKQQKVEYLIAQGWRRIANRQGGAWFDPERPGRPAIALEAAIRVAVHRSLRREVEK